MCYLLGCYSCYFLTLHFPSPTIHSPHSTSPPTLSTPLSSPASPPFSFPPPHSHATTPTSSQYLSINYYYCCYYYIVVSHHSFISVSYFITILSSTICLFIACSYVMGRSFLSTGQRCSNFHFDFDRLFLRCCSSLGMGLLFG